MPDIGIAWYCILYCIMFVSEQMMTMQVGSTLVHQHDGHSKRTRCQKPASASAPSSPGSASSMKMVLLLQFQLLYFFKAVFAFCFCCWTPGHWTVDIILNEDLATVVVVLVVDLFWFLLIPRFCFVAIMVVDTH